MEQISRKQYHIYILLFREAHDLVEAFPAIIAADVVALVVANVAVCSHENADSVCCCRTKSAQDHSVGSNNRNSSLLTCKRWHGASDGRHARLGSWSNFLFIEKVKFDYMLNISEEKFRSVVCANTVFRERRDLPPCTTLGLGHSRDLYSLWPIRRHIVFRLSRYKSQ